MNNRPANAEEIIKMQKEVEKAITKGAVGISTGLEYTPGSFASTDELIKMCEAAPEFARLYATHMRNEDDRVLESIDEAIKISKDSGSRLEISHLKTQGKSNWGKTDEALNRIDMAVKEGMEVHAD